MIGVAWALIQPLLTMLVMTVIFGRVAKLPSEGNAPYAVMVFAGMLPWYFFATSLSSSRQSLVGNAQLISRVYFILVDLDSGRSLFDLARLQEEVEQLLGRRLDLVTDTGFRKRGSREISPSILPILPVSLEWHRGADRLKSPCSR